MTNASHPLRNCVPIDFPRAVLRVFQTSTAPAFTKIFSDLEASVTQDSDMSGLKPKWPSISQINTLATNSYKRLKLEGEWVQGKKPGDKISSASRATHRPS